MPPPFVSSVEQAFNQEYNEVPSSLFSGNKLIPLVTMNGFATSLQSTTNNGNIARSALGVDYMGKQKTKQQRSIGALSPPQNKSRVQGQKTKFPATSALSHA